MGYTHYFNFKLNPNTKKVVYQEAFNNAVTLFNFCRNHFPIDLKLCNCDGYGEPEITSNGIYFNGDRENNLDYEGFVVDFKDNKHGFCKTARYPYDIAVCCALLCLKEMFGSEFEYISDGYCMTDYDKLSKEDKKTFVFEDEWIEALKVFKKALNDMFIDDYHSEVFNKKLKYLPKKKLM